VTHRLQLSGAFKIGPRILFSFAFCYRIPKRCPMMDIETNQGVIVAAVVDGILWDLARPLVRLRNLLVFVHSRPRLDHRAGTQIAMAQPVSLTRCALENPGMVLFDIEEEGES
jgi:hypothetical protein